MVHAYILVLPALLELRKLRQKDLEFLGRWAKEEISGQPGLYRKKVNQINTRL